MLAHEPTHVGRHGMEFWQIAFGNAPFDETPRAA